MNLNIIKVTHLTMEFNVNHAPLSISHPELVGHLDEEERELIKIGAMSLVCIENATELFRLFMMKNWNIEKITNRVVENKPQWGTIMSQTFPMYNNDEFSRIVEGYRKIIKSKLRNLIYRYIACVVAVKVTKSSNGHYGAIIWDRKFNIADIFDSMQASKNGSYYTHCFERVAKSVFGISNKNIRVPDEFSPETSLQYTGGSPHNLPHIVEVFQNELNPTTKRFLSIQSTESQNHFCLMWAIWYIHVRSSGRIIKNVITSFVENSTDPLVVIKQYTWEVLTALDMVDKIPQSRFFKRYFPCIWTNEPDFLSLDFYEKRVV